MDKDARIKELEMKVGRLEYDLAESKAGYDGLLETIADLRFHIENSRPDPRLGVWRDGDDVYLKGRWLCDLRPHGPAGDEFGTALTEVFQADGFISRSTKPRQVA